MTYLLDANIFIQAKKLHYNFDICPAFWDWLDRENASGKVFSIDRVRSELMAGADSLATWASVRGESFFLPLSADIEPSLPVISSWANNGKYEQTAVSTFLRVADYYLVAYAHARKLVVVTHELPSSSTKRIKIPDACIALDVKVISPYEMLRTEHARFVLESP
ncbi:MAG: DUF4411 family protein [Firmicutes bacterium]|nr:DUF4411 family protein [Bacillota bacterium]